MGWYDDPNDEPQVRCCAPGCDRGTDEETGKPCPHCEGTGYLWLSEARALREEYRDYDAAD